MKFCSFAAEGGTHVGVLTDRGIVDLTTAGIAHDMNHIIEENCLAKAASAAENLSLPAIPESELEYGLVVNPGKILCVGLNYKSHAEETGGTAPKDPVFFSKFSDCLHPAGKSVELPRWQRCYDYEAELVIVIGKTAYHVSEEDAMSYVFGYTCGNDLSARDCQFISNQWLSGKSFPGFAPAGPYIVTADNFNPDEANAIRCRLNGNTVQDGDTADMIFSCAQIISHASRYFRLEPGDLIFTGTPAGVILGKPKGTRVWMKSGDTVQVEIDGIGVLTTPLS